VWCQHNVSYDKLPDFFIAFDIYHKENDVYVNYQQFIDMIGGQFQTVPLLKKYAVLFIS
jgi:hypothetical protein